MSGPTSLDLALFGLYLLSTLSLLAVAGWLFLVGWWALGAFVLAAFALDLALWWRTVDAETERTALVEALRTERSR